MKIILSRKGFDSQNGKTPSPIMPNGDLISMPIPSGDKDRYQGLVYQGHDIGAHRYHGDSLGS